MPGKYQLIGIREAHYPEEHDEEKIVALFTHENDAKDYEFRSRLASFSQTCSRGQCSKQYRKSSLLRGFCRAYVEPYEPPDCPLDPEHDR